MFLPTLENTYCIALLKFYSKFKNLIVVAVGYNNAAFHQQTMQKFITSTVGRC